LGVSVISVTTQGLAVVRCITGVRGTSANDTLHRAAGIIHSFKPTKIVCEAAVDSLVPDQLASVLARRGFPCLIDRVRSGQRKGERIVDALGTPLADRRVILLESVVTSDDAAETVKQLVNVTRDGRSLRHDDRCDSLAWALATAAPMIRIDESDSLEMNARQTLDRLLKLPIRMGGLDEDSPEVAMYEVDENMEALRYKLDRALEQQSEDLRTGRIDPRFDAYIGSLRRELKKFNLFQH
jgi:hypothetical protein